MASPTFLFYDIETSGLNKCFDQVLQFAGVRTDLKLNILDQNEYLARLNCDTIPSPEAMITHRIRLEKLRAADCEVEIMQNIHRLLNTPNTYSIGYNNLGFDDEFLRFSFYRNLLPPYTHQYANQCSRIDLYPITVLYYLFKNEALSWPLKNEKISLKLENINTCNNFVDGISHQAMVDVEVCIALAAKLMQHQDMWNYAINFFKKAEDLKRIETLETAFKNQQQLFHQALLIHTKLGADLYYQAPVIGIGQHLHYKNQSLWLRLDTESLQKTTTDNIHETSMVFRKRAGEPPFLLPYKERFFQHLSEPRHRLAQENLAWLKKNPAILQEICLYHQNYVYPNVPFLDIDAALYQINFATPQEETLFKTFHAAKKNNKADFIHKFSNQTRKLQAIRILGRHYPEYLSEKDKELFQQYLNDIFQKSTDLPCDYRGTPRLTPANALIKIAELEIKLDIDHEQKILLNELREYLQNKVGGHVTTLLCPPYGVINH